MFEKVRELVAAQLGIDEAVIKPESNFKEDLKADSLDLFELVMSLEDGHRNQSVLKGVPRRTAPTYADGRRRSVVHHGRQRQRRWSRDDSITK